ncbi:MAG: hypothetical protein FWF63_07960 [Fibromonadales bacterium]|nr:hypothetical protein [Fibromonadales bacterium]
MGFLYCPNCNKGVSDLAEIPACPDCFHPFNAKMWRETYEDKQRKVEMEQQRKREQSETWERNGLCGNCGGRIEPERISKDPFAWGTTSNYTYYYKCSKCGKSYEENPPRKEVVDIPKPQKKTVHNKMTPLKYRELHAAFSKLGELSKRLTSMHLGGENYFYRYCEDEATQKTEEEKE